MGDSSLIFGSVFCDWMTIRHDYSIENPGRVFESGRVLKIDREGEIEFESLSWEQIKCHSSDTSIRIKCDGQHLWLMGNIGRFQESDNLMGYTVMECMDKWVHALSPLGIDLRLFGTRSRVGTLAEYGTHLTRLDLTGNFHVSDYPGLLASMSVRRINQKLPAMGKYGTTWGYDGKRSNWWRAKIYDKTAEMEGRRVYSRADTIARFEVQLGSEYLKRNGLDRVESWKLGENMENIVYGKFAEQIFREQFSAESWAEIPPRLRQHAILWRDGVDIRSQTSLATFYRVRKQLLDYGIDIGTPCNVVALTRQIKLVEVTPLNSLRNRVAA